MTIDHDMLVSFTLGMLTPEEERHVEAYLREHPEAAAEVRDGLDALAMMALQEEPAPVPEGSLDGILARIRAEERTEGNADRPQLAGPTPAAPRVEPTVPPHGPPPAQQPPARPYAWLAYAAAIALVALAYFGLEPRVTDWQARRQLDTICAQPAVVCQALLDEDSRVFGRAAIRPDRTLLVVLDAPPPANASYQAWEIADGDPRSLGVWNRAILDVSEPLEPGSVFGITVEPPGGSPGPTTTPIVVLPLSGGGS